MHYREGHSYILFGCSSLYLAHISSMCVRDGVRLSVYSFIDDYTFIQILSSYQRGLITSGQWLTNSWFNLTVIIWMDHMPIIWSNDCSHGCHISDPHSHVKTDGVYNTGYSSETHLDSSPPWTKRPPFWQTTFSNAFSWLKILEFRFKIHWNFFPGVQLTISHHWFS